MSKVLIIEDDVSIAGDLSRLMGMNGWTTETCNNGADGLQLLLKFAYDLVLLDWGLPELTGLEICKRYRGSGGTTPVIFITGQSDIDSKESGLDAGSDDYLTKPFNERELMARVRSAMRRPRAVVNADNIEIGGLVLDARRKTISQADEAVQLTAMEFSLIEYLARHKNESFTTSQLFAAVYHSDSETSEDTVRVHILILRRKLELAALPPIIVHQRGFGYRVEEPPAKQ